MQEINNSLNRAINEVAATGNLEGTKALSEALKVALPDLSAEKAKAILDILSAEVQKTATEQTTIAPSTAEVVSPQVECPIDTGTSGVAERVAAIHELGKRKLPETVLALVTALKDENADVRNAAAPALVELLKHSYGDKSPAIVQALISSGETVVPVLREALKPQGLIERLQLDFLGIPSRREPLQLALREITASKAREESLAEERKNLLETAYDQTLSTQSRVKAFSRLVEIKDPQAVPALSQALRDKNSDVRYRAAKALGKIKDPRAVEPLMEALKDEREYVRKVAAEALGERKDPRAVPALRQALKDKDSDVGCRAAGALWRIEDPAAVPALTQALKDEGVRKRAAGALVSIGKPAVPALIKALKDYYPDVREVAAEALQM